MIVKRVRLRESFADKVRVNCHVGFQWDFPAEFTTLSRTVTTIEKLQSLVFDKFTQAHGVRLSWCQCVTHSYSFP